jgi:hypothetical protein
MGQPERACVNCHFFTRKTEYAGGGVSQVPVPDTDRGNLRQSEMNQLEMSMDKRRYIVNCSRAVWEEKRGDTYANLRPQLVDRDRGEECYFRKYVPGMALPAAEELEAREQQARMAAQSMDLTRKSIKVATWGLFANVALGVIKMVLDLFKSH